jgi:hypothetical protein
MRSVSQSLLKMTKLENAMMPGMSEPVRKRTTSTLVENASGFSSTVLFCTTCDFDGWSVACTTSHDVAVE